MANNYSETLYDSYWQTFSIDQVYHLEKTDHQNLIIFHNAKFGRVMALDGIIQTTEKDEFIYHEMLTHTPILAHGHAKRVLIIGGGDGGILREVCRHQSVEHITQVEIDDSVVTMCKEFLPNHSQGAYNDPRLHLVIADGLAFVQQCQEKFDVIISDSTDPIGPGEVLFSEDFYACCQQLLSDDGILVTQNGVPYMQIDEVKNTAQRIQAHFSDWHFYSAAVPTYIGGCMTFAWASNNPNYRKLSLSELHQRYQQAAITTRYYNPDIHLASFALPQYVLTSIGKSNNAE